MRKFFTCTLILLLFACAGAKVRLNLLVPSIAAAWPAVVLQLNDAPEPVKIAAEAVGIALASGDPDSLSLSPYPIVLGYLNSALDKEVADGKISPAMREFLRIPIMELRKSFEALVVAHE